jgi:hypothetical protein
MSLFPRQFPPLFTDDTPYTYPDGSRIPIGLALTLASQRHITVSEARDILIEGWRGGKGNRAQRRQRKKHKDV